MSEHDTAAALAYWAGYVHGLTGGRWGARFIADAQADLGLDGVDLASVPGLLGAGWSTGHAERVTP